MAQPRYSAAFPREMLAVSISWAVYSHLKMWFIARHLWCQSCNILGSFENIGCLTVGAPLSPSRQLIIYLKKTIGDPDEIFSSCLQTSKECGLVQCHGQCRNVAQSKGSVAPLM
jgi:hypothetical protein